MMHGTMKVKVILYDSASL